MFFHADSATIQASLNDTLLEPTNLFEFDSTPPLELSYNRILGVIIRLNMVAKKDRNVEKSFR